MRKHTQYHPFFDTIQAQTVSAAIDKEEKRLFAYPQNRFSGKGIVLCAGGHRLLCNAYVCARFIREITDLPIELFYAGKDEVTPAVKELFEKEFSHLTLHDITDDKFTDLTDFFAMEHYAGCHMKAFGILCSSFQEVFFVDADNVCLDDFTWLFSWEEYKKTGAIFWQDLATTRRTRKILYTVLGLDHESMSQDREFESGQILIDKKKVWKALLLTCLVNSDKHRLRTFFHASALGDKDTFRLAFAHTNTPCTVIKPFPVRFGNLFLLKNLRRLGVTIKIQHKLGWHYATGMLQYDPFEKPLFAHKTVSEWDPYMDFANMAYIETHEKKWIESLLLENAETRGYEFLHEFNKKFSRLYKPRAVKVAQRKIKDAIILVLDGIYPLIRKGPD